MSDVFGIVCPNEKFGRNHDDMLREQAKVLDNMFLAAEDQGEDASGIFALDRGGSKSRGGLFKCNVKGRYFINRPEYIDIVRNYFGKELRMVICHTRCAGNLAPAYDMNNNHPIRARGVIGAHVGTITNHMFVWREYGGTPSAGKYPWRRGDVDSEALFYLLGYNVRMGKMEMEGAIVEASKILRGTYACAAMHLNRPGYLWLFTNQKKMHYYISPSLGQLIFSTRFSLLEQAVKTICFNLVEKYVSEVTAYRGLRINADNGLMRAFVLANADDQGEKVTNINVYKQQRNIGFVGM